MSASEGAGAPPGHLDTPVGPDDAHEPGDDFAVDSPGEARQQELSDQRDDPGGGRAPRRSRLVYVEVGLAVAIAACVFAVHDVSYMLGAPFWLDEAWVAVSTRVPLDRLDVASSVTPIGWTFLLRLIPFSGQQDLRLLTLLFAFLTVLAAYAFGRSLGLLPVVGGVLAAAAALLVPAMLYRDDLKQYTADAFVSVLLFALLSRIEAQWSRRRLVGLCATLLALSFLSHITLFVAAMGLGCLSAVQLIRRRWTEAIEAIVATVGTGVVLLVVFLVFDSGTQTAAYRVFWKPFYLPHGVHAALHYINYRLHQNLRYFGIAHLWILVVLVVLGIAVLAVRGRWATAAVFPAVAVLMLVLGRLGKYPLLDERTSTFLMVDAIVIAAVGVAGVATFAARRLHPMAGFGLAGLAFVAYLPGALPFVNIHSIPAENVRAQTVYVTDHAAPGDVVLVSLGASYGYGYYGPRPGVVKTPGIGYSMTYPPSDRIVSLRYREPGDVLKGIEEAVSMAPPGSRVWVIINHVAASEAPAWRADLAKVGAQSVGVAPNTAVEWFTVGPTTSAALGGVTLGF
jgi:hypothetical protein